MCPVICRFATEAQEQAARTNSYLDIYTIYNIIIYYLLISSQSVQLMAQDQADAS